MKVINLLAVFVLLIFCFQIISAQTKCDGKEVYAQKNCSGDEAVKEETELFRLINVYRKQNNLPEVPESKTLYQIANRHLLDINSNLKKLTHSWSDCEFDYKNSQTWRCIFDAPKKFDPAFTGTGYENIYYN
ncbi:MAG: CAP domain-containing protein [Pyrinomonadaceae bacterium]